MPRSTSTYARTKRKRKSSPEDEKAGGFTTADAVDASSVASQNKRPRRAAAVKAQAKMKVKEEAYDDDLPSPADRAVKPEPKLEPKLRVQVKPELDVEVRSSITPTKQGREKATREPVHSVGHSQTRAKRGRQEASAESVGSDLEEPPKSPSKTPRKAMNKDPGKREGKKVREERWKKWCDERKWIRQYDPGYEQKVGERVVHRSDAMSYYCLKTYEIDTVPYVPFENPHNPKSFGRSYNNANLRTLVSRKFAYLAGLDEDFDLETREADFLKNGWKLFNAYITKLEEGMKKKNKSRKRLNWGRLVEAYRRSTPPSAHDHNILKDRPFGSWTTRVYNEAGKYIGDRLDFQFDPDDDGDYIGSYGRYDRYRPRDVDWAWAIGGLCSCCDL